MELAVDAAPSDGALVRVNAPQPFLRGFVPAVREVITYRELLTNLVRKELKVKYKDSALGFLWSLIRPMCLLAVYYVVIGKFLGAGIPSFAIYLFSGLVAWDLFTAVLGGSTGAIVGNAGLVKKVYFPREILVLAVVGAALVHFALQLVVLFAAMLLLRFDFFGPNLLLLPVAFVVLTTFMTAVGLFLAAANVSFRDVQHLLEVFLLFWFWMTPIVYPINQALTKLHEHAVLGVSLATVYMLNPMANVVVAFQRAIYKHVTVNGQPVLYQADYATYLARLGAVFVFSLVLLWLAQRIFARAQGNFAQEL
jgi:ABC-2 type transport system permease protein